MSRGRGLLGPAGTRTTSPTTITAGERGATVPRIPATPPTVVIVVRWSMA
ncbi:hypothetical protein [Clavibacter capsici]|nr:hypothetical protein [Clavibacter capsici]